MRRLPDQLGQLGLQRQGDAAPVAGIQPVVRVAHRMHVAHGTRDLPGGDLEDLDCQRRVQVAACAGLDVGVAALLDERWQPADLQLASDQDQQVGRVELEDEARLGLDEVRVLISARQRLDAHLVAAHLLGDRPRDLRSSR